MERQALRAGDPAADHPALPSQGQARGTRHARRPRPASTTWASSPPSTRKPPAGTHPLRRPRCTATASPGRTGAVSGPQPAGRAGRAGQRRARLGRPAGRRRPGGGHHRDRRLPHRQGRRPGTHRRRARARRLDPRRHHRRPPRPPPAPAQQRTPPRCSPPPASPPRRTDMIDLKNHYGFTRTPFGKDLAPSTLLPLPRPRRGRRPDHLVRPRARPRGDNRRSRRRQDRLRPRRHRRARPDPAHPHLPPGSDHRHTRHPPPRGHRARRRPPTAPPGSPPRPHRCSPPSTTSAAASPCS